MAQKKEICSAQLNKYIKSRILSGEYPVGMRMPSVRRLAGNFHLGYGSVPRALCDLCDGHFLERQDGDGFFVRSRMTDLMGPEGILLVLCANYALTRKTGLYHTALQGFQEAAHRAGYGVMLRELVYGVISASALMEAAENVSGVAFLHEIDLTIKKYPVLKCPSVGLLVQNSWKGQVSTVNLDPIEAARDVCGYFRNARLQSPVIKICSSPKPVYRCREMVFSGMWQESGGRTMRFSGDFSRETPGRACGYFFTSDWMLQRSAEEYFRKTGRNLMLDFVVMAVDGHRLLNPEYYRFPTVAVDWKKMGELTCGELLRLCREPNAECRNLNITGTFIPPENHG